MDDHHIKVDLLKLLDDNHLTVAQGTPDHKNVLFVVSKSSAIKKLEEFTSCYADKANMKVATVEEIRLGKRQKHSLIYTQCCSRKKSRRYRL